MELDQSQRAAVEAVKTGRNVFITGPAGTGKSTVLQELQSKMRGMATVATTGIAAVNVGGRTLHSWMGIGLGEGSVKNLVRKVKGRGDCYQRVRNCRVLAIDEISMASGPFLDKIDRVLRKVRNHDAPFGGLQMVFFGDLLQLPPVSKEERLPLVFESQAWADGNVGMFRLEKIHRQGNDLEFAEVLNDLRMGKMTARASKLMNSRYRQTDETPEKKPIILHTHNRQVDDLNQRELDQIDSPTREYVAMDRGEPALQRLLDKNCIAPSRLILKKGAQVMLVSNIDTDMGLANGSMGKVIGFRKTNGRRLPEVEFYNGVVDVVEAAKWEIKDGDKVLAERNQIPLKLAWAVTVHKSQGCTFDKARIYLEHVFETGQAYVALSRVRTAEGLFIESGTKGNIMADERAVAFYESNGEEGVPQTEVLL